MVQAKISVTKNMYKNGKSGNNYYRHQ